MTRLVRIFALTTVALLVAGGAALACCHSGPVACCGADSESVSEHCEDGQTISMDCEADHRLIATTSVMSAKTLDPPLAAGVLRPLGPPMQSTGARTGMLPASVGIDGVELFTLFVALRL